MKCAIYIRVSTDREEQKTSLANQRDLFERYVQDKGWDIYDLYVDIELDQCQYIRHKKLNFL